MRPTVVLFDVDGTLLTSTGVGRRALSRAFGARHGRTDACDGFRIDGMTDPAIVRQALAAIGQPVTSEEIDAILATYLEVLHAEVTAAPAESYRLHAGVTDAVDALAARTGFAVGLGTGNVREGARIKLTRVGIYDRFAFGGFGCDDEQRVELLRRGAERGAEQLGSQLSECRVVVVGDTPKDVHAAHGIGATCIGVGTGSYAPEQLLAEGAHWAFQDLTAPGAMAALLGE